MSEIAPTNALSLLAAVPGALTVEDLGDVFYSPRLLLPALLPSVITNDTEYAYYCEMGFQFYFRESYEAELSSLPYVRSLVIRDISSRALNGALLVERVGILHGLLSALAFTHRALALSGLDVLVPLVEHFVFLLGDVAA